jgi:hypothetical protein
MSPIEQPDQPPVDPRERAIWEMTQRADELAQLRRKHLDQISALQAQLQLEILWEQRCAELEQYYRTGIETLAGAPVLLAPTDIRRVKDKPGLYIGNQLLGPQQVTVEQLTAYLETLRSVHTEAWAEGNLIKELLRGHQDTLATRELAPEDQPQPDPLTATPAEESGAHAVVPPAEADPAPLPQRVPGATRASVNGRFVQEPQAPDCARLQGKRVEVTTTSGGTPRGLLLKVEGQLLYLDTGEGPLLDIPLDSIQRVVPERPECDVPKTPTVPDAMGWAEAFKSEHADRLPGQQAEQDEAHRPDDRDGDDRG